MAVYRPRDSKIRNGGGGWDCETRIGGGRKFRKGGNPERWPWTAPNFRGVGRDSEQRLWEKIKKGGGGEKKRETHSMFARLKT